jgi:hypothetical protein
MRIQVTKVLAILLVCVWVNAVVTVRPVMAQEKPATAYKLPVDYAPIIAKLKEQLPQQMAQASAPGLAIALVDGETLVWAEIPTPNFCH